MNSKDDMNIAKKLGLSVMDWHELLSKMERLDARELNLVAMQLINRSTMHLELTGCRP
jgi:hypothetical protein